VSRRIVAAFWLALALTVLGFFAAGWTAGAPATVLAGSAGMAATFVVSALRISKEQRS
jgi:hypothetical protein